MHAAKVRSFVSHTIQSIALQSRGNQLIPPSMLKFSLELSHSTLSSANREKFIQKSAIIRKVVDNDFVEYLVAFLQRKSVDQVKKWVEQGLCIVVYVDNYNVARYRSEKEVKNKVRSLPTISLMMYAVDVNGKEICFPLEINFDVVRKIFSGEHELPQLAQIFSPLPPFLSHFAIFPSIIGQSSSYGDFLSHLDTIEGMVGVGVPKILVFDQEFDTHWFRAAYEDPERLPSNSLPWIPCFHLEKHVCEAM